MIVYIQKDKFIYKQHVNYINFGHKILTEIVDCMGRPGFTIINQQYPKLTGPFGNRPQSDLKSHPKGI